MPPQSPARRCTPAAAWLVKTIGSSAVPSAMIFAPASTRRMAFDPLSPLMVVPFSIVRVAPAFTRTRPLRR